MNMNCLPCLLSVGTLLLTVSLVTAAGTGDTRLAEGSNRCEGILQVLLSGAVTADSQAVSGDPEQAEWADSCSHQFGESEATVVCRQLGCEGGERVHPKMFVDDFMVDTGQIVPLPLSCAGFEESLSVCQLAAVNCNHLYMDGADVIAVKCNATDLTPASTPTVSTDSGTATAHTSPILLLSCLILLSLQLHHLLHSV